MNRTPTPPRVAVVPRLAPSGDLAQRQRAVLRLIADAEAENKNLAPAYPCRPDEVEAQNKNLLAWPGRPDEVKAQNKNLGR